MPNVEDIRGWPVVDAGCCSCGRRTWAMSIVIILMVIVAWAAIADYSTKIENRAPYLLD
jgi:hypothetical protein